MLRSNPGLEDETPLALLASTARHESCGITLNHTPATHLVRSRALLFLGLRHHFESHPGDTLFHFWFVGRRRAVTLRGPRPRDFTE